MLDLETIGYFLFMEQQEQKDKDIKTKQKEDATRNKIEQEKRE